MGLKNRATRRRRRGQVEKELELDKALIDRADPIAAMSDLSNNGFAIGQFEGMISEVTKYYEITRGLESEFGTAMLDRAYFEVDAARQKKELEEKSAASMRQAGRLDYAVAAFRQWKDTKTERQFRGYWKQFLDYSYDFGYATGIYEDNSRLAGIYDKRIHAAGGDKSLQVLKAEMENVEV